MIEIIFPEGWSTKQCQRYVYERALLSVRWLYRYGQHGKFTCTAKVHVA